MKNATIQYIRLKSGGYRLHQTATYFTGIKGWAARILDRRTGKVLAEHTQDGWLHVHPGYQWDGASGPVVDRRANMRAGLFHDVLYQFLRQGSWPASLRKEADRVYREAYAEDGGWRFIGWLDYAGLRVGAGYAAARQREVEETVLSAP